MILLIGRARVAEFCKESAMKPSPSFSRLSTSKYVSLTTFRRNGSRVSTPVWIAPATERREVLYVLTMVGAGKLKRIRNNPAVELEPCDFRGRIRGAVVAASASILPTSQHDIADRALTAKYRVAKRLLDVCHRLGGGRRTYIQLELVADAAGAGELAG
jgi:PPOX class probable F420-dependent enzyme